MNNLPMTTAEILVSALVEDARAAVKDADVPGLNEALDEIAARHQFADGDPDTHLMATLASCLTTARKEPPYLPVLARLDLTVLTDLTDDTDSDSPDAIANNLFQTARWIGYEDAELTIINALNDRSASNADGLNLPSLRSPRLDGVREDETASTCTLTGVPFETDSPVPCLVMDDGETYDVHPVLVAAGPCYVASAGIHKALLFALHGEDQTALDTFALISGLDA